MIYENVAVIAGCLARTIELRKTQDGKSVVNFTVAVNDGYGENKTADFIDCVAWDKKAEFLAQYADKGTRICVKGKLKTKTSQDERGNWSKETKIVTEKVSIENVNRENTDAVRSDSTQASNSPTSYQRTQETARNEPYEPDITLSNDGLNITAEDLPF